MVFSSLEFLFFYFPMVLAVMKCSPLKYRNFCFFILSLFFYGWSEPFYVVLMLLSTIVDYFNGRMVEKYAENRKKAFRFVLFSIIFNLGLLGFFKYTDFIISLLNQLGMNLTPLGITLPVGISFYSFQTMSYPIDVYRGQAKAQKSIIDFGTYVAMFPQLIAGPIVRYKDIADQLQSRSETSEKFAAGVRRFTVGLFKKVFFANNAGAIFTTISALSQKSMLLSWMGLVAYAFQIYFDFSGYSDMAIGLGKMFGFELLENFNYPYISQSITEFWRRWHISLGSWFRDYLYIPLGGNRHGTLQTLRNLLIVWFLTGLWHGAALNFVLWGLYFGFLLILEKLFVQHWLARCPRGIRHFYALFLILIGWLIFAFDDLSLLSQYGRSLFQFQRWIDDTFLFMLRENALFLILAGLACTPLLKQLYDSISSKIKQFLNPVLVLASLLICTAYLVEASFNPFLYFRF